MVAGLAATTTTAAAATATTAAAGAPAIFGCYTFFSLKPCHFL